MERVGDSAPPPTTIDILVQYHEVSEIKVMRIKLVKSKVIFPHEEDGGIEEEEEVDAKVSPVPQGSINIDKSPTQELDNEHHGTVPSKDSASASPIEHHDSDLPSNEGTV